jgi:hypothetical protein
MGSKLEWDFCQYFSPDLEYFTLPDRRRAMRLRKWWWKMKKHFWYFSVLGPRLFLSRALSSGEGKGATSVTGQKELVGNAESMALNLQPEDLVEVRSEKEILITLDRNGKLKGLRFTPEMSKYCGKRFKVYKRLSKIIIESTGELRTIKSPTVLLEGVICDGKAHGGCDRTCFCFWREAWLKRVPSQG